MLKPLTAFDKFVIGEIMAADGRFDYHSLRSTFSYGLRGKWGYGDLFLKYCNITRQDPNTILMELTAVMLRIKFFQRSG